MTTFPPQCGQVLQCLPMLENFELLVFTDDGVPTWEVYKRIEGSSGRDLVTRGTADTFEAAQAAALSEVVAARPSE